jgi:beta propeller repeat protein
MKNQIFSISLIFIFFVVLATVASATQITKIGSGSEPAIYGSKILWTDGSIHVYDLITKKDTKINSSAASHPTIFGNKSVWLDETGGKPRLTVYDIKTGARSYITKGVDNSSIPVIYGNRIVWSANMSVYMRDISRSTQTKIANGENPDIYDTRITYEAYTGGDPSEIYVYNITTNNTVKVGGGDAMFSHIYGNKVIWSDFNMGLGNILMYDIVTKNLTEVTTGDGMTGYDTGGSTDVYGDRIVYIKRNNSEVPESYIGLGDVYVYSIATGNSTLLFASNNSKTPSIYDNVVVWSDNGSIYMTDLSAKVTKPEASFTANKVSGTHPLTVTFTSKSTGSPTTYFWDFGDKIYSKHAVTATHTFKEAGIYTVSLTVRNSAGNHTLKKTKYITVN